MFNPAVIAEVATAVWNKVLSPIIFAGERKRLQELSSYYLRRSVVRQSLKERIIASLAELDYARQMERNSSDYWGLSIEAGLAEPILHELPILVSAELAAQDRALRPVEWILN